MIGPQHAQEVHSVTFTLECPDTFNFDLCQTDVELLMFFRLTIYPALTACKACPFFFDSPHPTTGSVRGMGNELRIIRRFRS